MREIMDRQQTEGRLVRLALTLDVKSKDFTYNKSSLFHGILMEIIDEEYAGKLHQQGLKPFSQYLSFSGEQVVWYICTLSDEAYQKIICPLLEDAFCEIELKYDKMLIGITNKSMEEVSIDKLLRNFYSETSANIFYVKFLTPTAFKKGGRYSFYPDMFHIYQSLMRRFDEVSDRGNMFNPDTLEQLVENTEIIGYSLHSVRFSLEGVKIPAFMGGITIKLHGAQTMSNFAKLLFEFGNYSGVGIKTSMGMGSVQINEKRRETHDRTGS